jgi:hypothetical protein
MSTPNSVAEDFTETSIKVYQATRHYVLGENNLYYITLPSVRTDNVHNFWVC